VAARRAPAGVRRPAPGADLDERVAGIAGRGMEPAGRETYPDGVRKITYADPEGNEIGFGEVPAE